MRTHAARPEEQGWLTAAVRDIVEAGGPELLARTVAELDVRPVFTAHPTEASRRSVLELLRKIADVVAALAEKHAMVPRRTLTHGSVAVSIRAEVTAWMRAARTSSGTPARSPTRAHSRRSARSLAIVGNCSAVAA